MTPDQDQPQTETSIEEGIEDLEATDQVANDLTGGTIHRVPGKYKAGNITVTRQSDSD